MCGIIGVLGRNDVAPSILEGLKRLEYRGYDSAGIATLEGGRLDRRRAAGKLSALGAKLKAEPLRGRTGIGHTRWATHGAATDENAHPHATDRVALVHNGIIENFAALRDELKAKGVSFSSQTDTEVCAQLMTQYLETENCTPLQAFEKMLNRLRGAFAIAAIVSGEDDLLLIARRGSPLAVGRGDGEMFIGSDAFALAPFTNRVTYLEDGDWAGVTRAGLTVHDQSGEKVTRRETVSAVSGATVGKDGHRHFMAKEIHEQPEVVAHTLMQYIDPVSFKLKPFESFNYKDLERLTISACGTAFYAGLIARYWFETWAKLPVDADIASELRYRDIPYPKNGGALFISQSGETADTLAALRDAKERGQHIGALVNVAESSIAREADCIVQIAAGPEIGVASTKAFTCQLAGLACLAIAAGRARNVLSAQDERELVAALLETPRLISEALAQEDNLKSIAGEIAKASDILFVGRGVSYPLAMEGALKLKEVSYIHAEGYAAGELKHGPIALIDGKMPVVVVAPSDRHYEKTISNMHEVIARGGKPLLISDKKGIAAAGGDVWRAIEAPATHEMLSPIVYAVLVQFLAYYTATAKGTDVDQPRNLAKSVTVE